VQARVENWWRIKAAAWERAEKLFLLRITVKPQAVAAGTFFPLDRAVNRAWLITFDVFT